MPPRPSTLIAELSYQCPLHCPYCSNPLDIGGEHYRRELETEHWIRAFGEARRLGVLQLASRCCAAISSSSAPARAMPACTRR
jgi:pyrroloquinoline quinone biosynthesis protein E